MTEFSGADGLCHSAISGGDSVLQSKQATLCQHFGDALDLVMPKIW
jgi:hypothetical protein